MKLICKLRLHKWITNYDPMYNLHSRKCKHCGVKQVAKEIKLTIKYKYD